MKTLIATAALALTVSAPAFADSQLAASLGVDAGDYTVAELVRLDAAINDDDHSVVRFILSGDAANAAPTMAGQDFAVAHAFENDEPARAVTLAEGGTEVVSTQSIGASDVLAFAIEVAEENDDHARANYLRSLY